MDDAREVERRLEREAAGRKHREGGEKVAGWERWKEGVEGRLDR